MELALLHRSFADHHCAISEHDWLTINLSSPIEWRTCLRQIFFLNSTEIHLVPEAWGEILTGQKAMTFILSVLCGLKSKVKGETEILGQFKKFIDENSVVPGLRDPSLKQNILKEVKTLRDQYISGLGASSYGSLLRKKLLANDQITIVGAGQIAQDLLPWFKKWNTQLLCRDPRKYLNLKSQYSHLTINPLCNQTSVEASVTSDVLIIAAPLSSSEVNQLIRKHKSYPRMIIDFRSESESSTQDFLDINSEIFLLNDLFNDLSKTQQFATEQLKSAEDAIQLRATALTLKASHRPMGWDDLCA